MKYEAKAWKESEGACLRNFNEQAQIESVNGALALRSQIENVIDQIWEEGFDGIYFIGIGGTYASGMQVEVYMRGRSKLPVYVENAKCELWMERCRKYLRQNRNYSAGRSWRRVSVWHV